MAKKQILPDITTALTQRASQGLGAIGANEIAAQVGGARPTVNRYLAKLVAGGAIVRQGTGPATVYTIAAPVQHALSTATKVRPTRHITPQQG